MLLVCDEAGLIGKEMFAVDGVKLPSNASKEWSGSQAEYSRKIEKMERAVRHLTQRHREADVAGEDEGLAVARAKQQATLEKALAKVRGYLQGHEDKVGASGRIKQSNITDNESAKMMSSKGVIQGYTAVALVDGKHQIVVHAEAHGEGQEHGLLIPMIKGAREHFAADPFKEAAVLADAGYCSEANAQYLSEEHIDGYLADPMFRKRDPRFIDAARHKPTRPDEPFAKPKRGSASSRRTFRSRRIELTRSARPANGSIATVGIGTCRDTRRFVSAETKAIAETVRCESSASGTPSERSNGRGRYLLDGPKVNPRPTVPG
jgi:hypothetical protein